MKKDLSILDVQIDRKTIQKNAFNSIIIQVIFKLKGLITMPIMTYFLLPREMGVFNLITVTAYLLYPLFSLNLLNGPAVYLIQETSKERIRQMYNTAVTSSLMFYVFFTLISFPLMHRIGGKYYQYFFLLLPMLYSILFYLTHENVLIYFQKTTILVRIVFLKDLCSTIIIVLLVIAGFSYYGMVVGSILSDLVAGFYIRRLINHDLPFKFFIDKDVLIKFLKISLPLIPVYIFSWVAQSSNAYFLAYFRGEDSVGKYSVTAALSGVILIFTYALNMFWSPVSAKLWVENKDKYKKTFALIFAAFSLFLLTVVLLFEFNAKIIFQILVKRQEYQDAYLIFGLVALGFSFQVLITLLSAPLYANKKPGLIFYSYLAGSLAMTLLSLILTPRYGILGAACSSGFSFLIILLTMSYLNHRVIGFSFFDKRLFSVMLAFPVFWIILRTLREHLGLAKILAGDVMIGAIFAGLIYFGLLKKNEKQFILAYIKEFKFSELFRRESR